MEEKKLKLEGKRVSIDATSRFASLSRSLKIIYLAARNFEEMMLKPFREHIIIHVLVFNIHSFST